MMSHTVRPKLHSYQMAFIAATIGLVVAVVAVREAVVKLSNDDCTSTTTTLSNVATKTVRTCS